MKIISGNKKSKTKIVAHRGLSGVEFENTISSFVAAGNTDCYGIETDVHKTLDGKFVAIHDSDTSRVSDVTAEIETSLYSDLKEISLGHISDKTVRTDRKIPDLSEYIDICKTYKKTAVLELKNHFEPEDIKNVIKTIENAKYLSQTVFISFDFDNLKAVRSFLPDQAVQFLCSNADGELIKKLKLHKMDVDIKQKALDKKLIKEFHDNGIKVNCWVVNDEKRAKKLIKYGIDYITTDFAGRLL